MHHAVSRMAYNLHKITFERAEARRRVNSKPSSVASAPDADETARAFGSTVGEVWKAMSGLNLPLPALTQVQTDYVKEAADLWNQSLQRLQVDRLGGDDAAGAGVVVGDVVADPRHHRRLRHLRRRGGGERRRQQHDRRRARYFQVTSIAKKCMNTARAGRFFGFASGLRM